MDINNYSYSPYMLDTEERNDKNHASLPYWDIEEEALKEVKQALKAVQEATN